MSDIAIVTEDIELEDVITRCRPRRVGMNDPLSTTGRHDVAGHRGRRVQVVVDIEPIAFIAQLG